MGRVNEPGAPIRRVGVVLKGSSPEALELGRQLLAELERLGLESTLDAESAAVLGSPNGCDRGSLASRVDLVVVLGGDGTLLSVAHGCLGGTPILGINMGTLGFLTEHPPESLLPMLNATLAGRTAVERRERFEVEVVSPKRETISRLALNDAVITKAALARIVTLTAHVNNEFVSRFRADGLIVATPTGSTAYNLSAGGPILYPTLEVMLLTPICPHTLTNRPIALPLDAVVEIRLESRSEEVYLTLDGQEGFSLTPRDLVRVRRASEPLRLIIDPSRSYFQILNHKLKWGERGG
jgi:NAD+ kinase